MRGPQGAKRSAQRGSVSIVRNMCVFLLAMIGSSLLLYSDFSVTRGYDLPVHSSLRKTVITNGADRWEGDELVTAEAFDFPLRAARGLSVSPLFQPYYSDHR
jgi:hypothetical protein